MSFNPHTHEGCDTTVLILDSTTIVSIHTPTKGVTNFQQQYKPLSRVSIHTPTKGVTFTDIIYSYDKRVSIHTPTKGVT